MAQKHAPIEVSVEAGAKRVFAGALDWPGWCRSGRDEAAALDALVVYATRYAKALKGTRSGFRPPKAVSELKVVERQQGDATTDFGAPGMVPAADRRPLDARDLKRARMFLEASWAAFDRAADDAIGIQLRTGPRGGGRSLDKIAAHVLSSEAGYVRRIAAKPPNVDEADPWAVADEVRDVVLEALSRAVTDGVPERGPRGGVLSPARYFVRRDVWHVLDHAWEIEDRSSDPAG
jgi:hypothetical protein